MSICWLQYVLRAFDSFQNIDNLVFYFVFLYMMGDENKKSSFSKELDALPNTINQVIHSVRSGMFSQSHTNINHTHIQRQQEIHTSVLPSVEARNRPRFKCQYHSRGTWVVQLVKRST